MITLPKFRAYDVQWDTMYYSHEHENSPFECRVNLYRGEWEVDLCSVDMTSGDSIGTAGIDGKKYILMQYLDLKDEDGQQLCIGDIVKRWDELMHIEDVFTVGFMNHECTLMDGDFKIMGNIHENPGLMPF